jgi:F0F1-type ATP synthase membrane subunit b/b'
LELKKEEKVKKTHEGYIHTTKIFYPTINVKNMLESWEDTKQKYEEWLSKYDEYVEVAKSSAEKGFDIQVDKLRQELDGIDKLDKEGKYNHWMKIHLDRRKELVEAIEKREENIKNIFEENKKLLDKYKLSYQEELKNKVAAIKKWKK